jgi:hypothetical protein
MQPETLDYGTTARRINGIALTAAALLVFAAHFALQFVLYRGRMMVHWALADSDLLVFYAPLALALAGYALILSRVAAAKPWNRAGKAVFVVAFTLMAGFFSFWWSMLLPLNTYGS